MDKKRDLVKRVLSVIDNEEPPSDPLEIIIPYSSGRVIKIRVEIIDHMLRIVQPEEDVG